LHQAIAAASHNPNIELTLHSLEARLDGLTVPSLSLAADHHDERRTKILEFEHLAIVAAIEQSEPEAAECAMRLHLLRARSRIIAKR
jgi:DNA-binding FadR family transcriptional regulator